MVLLKPLYNRLYMSVSTENRKAYWKDKKTEITDQLQDLMNYDYSYLGSLKGADGKVSCDDLVSVHRVDENDIIDDGYAG